MKTINKQLACMRSLQWTSSFSHGDRRTLSIMWVSAIKLANHASVRYFFLFFLVCRVRLYSAVLHFCHHTVVHHTARAALLLALQCLRAHHTEALRHCCESFCKRTVKFLRGGYLLPLNFTPAGPIFSVPLKRASYITMRLLHSAWLCRNWLLSLFLHILQLTYFIQRWYLSQLE